MKTNYCNCFQVGMRFGLCLKVPVGWQAKITFEKASIENPAVFVYLLLYTSKDYPTVLPFSLHCW